ncbi:hypothetical protein ACIGB6_01195 [Paeniglutamicibacter gangotriensis]|uniref:hypothetical protein n=1 Tax=Paeniglutamicibacter gangotriensis TaxID=254787 RepID=UPI0037C9F26E
MTDYSRDSRLSPGALTRLENYTSLFADEIVSEAKRLNPDDVITSRDVVDAYSILNRAPQGIPFDSMEVSWATNRATRRNIIYSALAGILSLIAAVMILVTGPNFLFNGGGIVEYVAIFAAYLAALLSFSAAWFSWLRVRRDRSRAVREAEMGARDAEKAYLYAEAMHSNRSGGRDDDKYQTARFISEWARLEDRLRRLAQLALSMPAEVASDYPIRPLLKMLTEVGVLDSNRGEEFTQIMDVRNRLAHGGRASRAETQLGLDYMDVLENFLDAHIQEHTSPN